MKHAVSPIRTIIVSLTIALFVVACGAGGVGGVNIAGGGIGGTGVSAVSVGPITQFGSIFVNGVEYDLKDAAIVVNGQQVTTTGDDGNTIAPQKLAVGQVVKVQGTINADGTTGTATQVTFSGDVNGPVSTVTDIDANTKKIVVLGQTVIVDNTTQLKNLTFSDLVNNNSIVVEVSGLANKDGDIHATYLEKTEDSYTGSYVDVKGTIQSLDTTAGTFMIKGQLVDYVSGSPDVSTLPNGTPADGQYVEVTGLIDITSGNLVASVIKLENEGLGSTDSQQADLTGFVTATSSSGFTLGTQAVETTTNTAYKGGVAADIAVGVRLEIEGALQNGVLTATQITFTDRIELEANVEGVDTGNNTLTLTGLNGITVTVNSLTQLNGITGLSDLHVGDSVKVRGRPGDTTGTVIATGLEKESSLEEVTLQGPVDYTAGSSQIKVLGITIDASVLNNGLQVLSSLKAGDIVNITGTQNGSTITWTDIEMD